MYNEDVLVGPEEGSTYCLVKVLGRVGHSGVGRTGWSYREGVLPLGKPLPSSEWLVKSGWLRHERVSLNVELSYSLNCISDKGDNKGLWSLRKTKSRRCIKSESPKR